MNIIINREKLQTALRIVDRIVSRNASLPILNTILLKTENNHLELTATNLEMGIKYWVGAKVNTDGRIAVPARVFSDFIGNVNDEKLTLSVQKHIISINSEHYKTQILGLDPVEFPILPKISGAEKIILNDYDFRDAIATVLDSASLSDTRPEISGVSMMINGGKAVFAATDSFRLAERVVNMANNNTKTAIIIPKNAALELSRMITGPDASPDISLSISDNQLFVIGDNYEFVSRLIDGRYPDYQKIIPEKYISSAIVNRGELERNIKMTSVFSSAISDIKLSAENNNIRLKASNSDRGEIAADIPCSLKEKPFEIAVNYRYLLDGIKVLPTENISICYTGDGSPLVLRSEDKKDRVYLIMPLRN